ncbi:protease HtpX [Sedimenticola selenatireducens]|jgi:heat shock protein HtpX|uniref:Protease HtpX n=2 Tax=Sedimenticola TaxID=349742 RepID=A0A558CKW9_9GAMM|nr:protease HtpX [Sedimenticola selenatireducens]MCW8921213.1 protease HtpX [Sedimenticola sp.]TVO75195.1 protease HtpX [Sedimenticola selenatireducens]TVT49413.1 MAG: protease HtpX [Sedimenticola thiotaurini]TVT66951.1 MAG: protease HtpX [Sedimenticola selenatireducens]
MKRIVLFLATNLAVVAVLSVTLRLLGVERILDEQGIGLDINSLVIFAAVLGFGGALVSLFISKWTAKRMMGLRVIETPSSTAEKWLVDTIKRQSQEAGIGMPEVAIYEGAEMNAFATGWNRNNALVAVSTGLLQQMDRSEVEAVLGHEVSHVANGDMITMALIQGVVNTFVIVLSRVIGHMVDRVVFKTERGHGPAFWITSIVAELVLGFLASIIVMWFSRQREYRADAGGAKLADRNSMINALARLGGVQAEGLPDQLAAFGISGGKGLGDLFRTHPKIEDRIARLRAEA